jgi:hypothetical protein
MFTGSHPAFAWADDAECVMDAVTITNIEHTGEGFNARLEGYRMYELRGTLRNDLSWPISAVLSETIASMDSGEILNKSQGAMYLSVHLGPNEEREVQLFYFSRAGLDENPPYYFERVLDVRDADDGMLIGLDWPPDDAPRLLTELECP